MKHMKNSTTPKPPDHLSREAKGWWRKINAEWELGADALLILRSALESFDRCDQARKLLDKEGLVILDRFEQQKAHPAATIERDSRLQMVRCWRALNLDVEPPRSGPGRPPGR